MSASSSGTKSILKDKTTTLAGTMTRKAVSFFTSKKVNLTAPTITLATYDKSMDGIVTDDVAAITTSTSAKTLVKISDAFIHEDDMTPLARKFQYKGENNEYTKPYPTKEDDRKKLYSNEYERKEAMLKLKEQDLDLTLKVLQEQLVLYLAINKIGLSLDECHHRIKERKDKIKEIIKNVESKYQNAYAYEPGRRAIYKLSQEVEYFETVIACHENKSASERKIKNLQQEINNIVKLKEDMEYAKKGSSIAKDMDSLFERMREIEQRTNMVTLGGKYRDQYIEELAKAEKLVKLGESSHQVEVNEFLKENKKLNKESKQLKDTSNNQYPDTLFKKDACQKTEAGRVAQSHHHNLEASIIVFGM